jgi:RNA polymerase sigma factor (sigma-70 family)
VCPTDQEEERSRLAPGAEAARKRAAIETYARHEGALRRTARRYSLCADDADDALQRGLEILLRKAPTDDPRQLIRWTQTVVKHEALAVRRERERILAGPVAEEEGADWVALIPSGADGPPERAERREAVARSREALQSLKPQELRALALLAEGYSYAEIGEITGFSRTKINRCLAEGRERFRSLLSRSADGRRCAELRPTLSAFCDGEASAAEASALREHLRACAHCRATMRAYRAAPAAAAALAPALPLGRSLLGRLHDGLAALGGRFGGSEAGVSQMTAAGGSRGAGMAALAKALAICVGTAGGAAACAATGVIPVPFEAGHQHATAPRLERRASPAASEADAGPVVGYEPEPEPAPPPPEAKPAPPPEPAEPVEPAAPSGSVEYAPPPPAASGSQSPSGSPAGEFGP